MKRMYREVAERPDGAFHFELGEEVALRVGYGTEHLATVPTEAVDSFAGVGMLYDRVGLEPREALGRLSGGRSRTLLQSSKAPRPQACHFGRHNRERVKQNHPLSPTRTQTHLGDVS
ncbi:MAG: hypothetical protein ACRDP1_06455 [Nocardioidaceae bacterium]